MFLYTTVHSQRQLGDIGAVRPRENLMGGCEAWGRILCAVSLGSQSEEFLKPSEILHASQDETLLCMCSARSISSNASLPDCAK